MSVSTFHKLQGLYLYEYSFVAGIPTVQSTAGHWDGWSQDLGSWLTSFWMLLVTSGFLSLISPSFLFFLKIQFGQLPSKCSLSTAFSSSKYIYPESH